MKMILETKRLVLREITEQDAGYMLKLLNSPGWLKFIGDRNIRSIECARKHIVEKYISMYEEHGFGLWLVQRKSDLISIGTCGLLKRPHLKDVDIGFAFSPEYHGQGYAFEAASATMNYGKNELGLKKIVAITIPENTRSINLLTKLGLVRSEHAMVPGEEECVLFEPSMR